VSDQVQVVDENDKPIGGVDIREAWEKSLPHRISRVMVQDEKDGSLLLQLRVKSKYLFPECWDNSAAGHVDAGESYEAAAIRELNEEMGISGVKLGILDYYYSHDMYKEHNLCEWNKVYLAKISREYKVKKQDNEVAEIKWFSKSELRGLLKQEDKITPGLKYVLKRNPFLYESR
jgi:isopentenyl-diphosphate delta-isomerase type 1